MKAVDWQGHTVSVNHFYWGEGVLRDQKVILPPPVIPQILVSFVRFRLYRDNITNRKSSKQEACEMNQYFNGVFLELI